MHRPLLSAATVALVACALPPGTLPARPPNVVLIVADDLGYRDLGCFGSAEVRTPNLDRLASDGVRLTSFYMTWPACTPSRGSLLTGRYPQRNGLYEQIRNDLTDTGYRYDELTYATSPEMTLGLDLREVTFAQPLRDAGYATGIVGKWDSGRALRFLPLQRGFDFFYGFANTGIDYWTHERYGIPSMFRGNEPIKEEGYATDLFRREAVRFIRENKHRPFALYVPFNAPHGPSNLERTGMQAPEECVRLYAPLDPKANRTRYLACITSMDAAVGEILDALRESGLERDTFVLFSSDNGATRVGDNRPLRGGKSELFEGGVRVPTIARWPGRIPAGGTCDAFLSSLEVFPTLLAIAGAAPPRRVVLDGFDMLPVLEGKGASTRRDLFWDYRRHRAARVGPYKWVEGRGLFDLSSDVGEERDLSSEKPEILRELADRWALWKKAMDASEPRGPFRRD